MSAGSIYHKKIQVSLSAQLSLFMRFDKKWELLHNVCEIVKARLIFVVEEIVFFAWNSCFSLHVYLHYMENKIAFSFVFSCLIFFC